MTGLRDMGVDVYVLELPMYSLVVLCCENYGIANHRHCVVTDFESEKQAYEYALSRLVDAGQLIDHGGSYSVKGETELHHSAADVVEQWAGYLGMSEYFHVVPQIPRL